MLFLIIIHISRLSKMSGLKYPRSATFTVRLSNRPVGEVFIVIKSVLGNVILSGGTISENGALLVGAITKNNWKSPFIITVTSIYDQYAEWSKLQAHLNQRYSNAFLA